MHQSLKKQQPKEATMKQHPKEKSGRSDARGLHEGKKGETMDGKAGRSPKGHLGDHQGNMSPVVESLQRPSADYSQNFLGKTTEYIERQDRQQKDNARHIENKGYKGRYS